MSRSFDLVDVFGLEPFSGNPLAVVTSDVDFDTAEMQRIARWLNLSETTFLLPPTDPRADYRVRIFSLTQELSFAGHPTLGTCHVWLNHGGRPQSGDEIVQQCGAGLVHIRRSGGRLAFAAPPLIRSGPVDEADLVAAAKVLRIPRAAIVDAQWADNGPGWLAILLASSAEVLAVEPERSHDHHVDIGLVGACPPGSETAFELRALFSDQYGTLIEDPVTGSLNASVAGWLYASGRIDRPYVAAQGTRLGRTGRIHVERDAEGRIWTGGATRTLVRGHCA